MNNPLSSHVAGTRSGSFGHIARITAWLCLAAGVLSAPAALAEGRAPAAGSIWRGTFSYVEDNRPASAFKITFDKVTALAEPGVYGIQGTTSEPRSDFGPANATTLTATFAGIWIAKNNGAEITFTKTYDYDKHTVEYHGSYDENANTVAGIWHVADYYGRFTLSSIRLSGAR